MITILRPDANCPSDRIGEWLQLTGIPVTEVPLWEAPVPSAGTWGEAAIILGGRMNALDSGCHPWIAALESEILAARAASLPVLGVCLGHQIIAHAVGGTVVVGDAAGGEDGIVPIALTDAGANDPVFSGVGNTFPAYESHHDVVAALPDDATVLASSATYPIQAFRFGSLVGVQFHPEATPQRIAAWRAGDGQDVTGVVESLTAADEPVRDAGKAILDGFLRAVR